MSAGTSVFAGVAVVIGGLGTLAGACSGPVQGGSTDYTGATPISTSAASTSASAGAAAPVTAITASTTHPGPSDIAASVPPPAATVSVAAAPPPAAPTVTATPSATPASTVPAAAGTTKPAGTGFNAGSGTAMPDGKTIEYHIPDGTGGKDWNPKENPIRVRRGMVLHLVDDDKSTRSGGHWLHTNGQPCTHGLMAIGQGFDCKISTSAPTGLISGVFEHNVANGIGQLHIEVVADAN